MLNKFAFHLVVVLCIAYDLYVYLCFPWGDCLFGELFGVCEVLNNADIHIISFETRTYIPICFLLYAVHYNVTYFFTLFQTRNTASNLFSVTL